MQLNSVPSHWNSFIINLRIGTGEDNLSLSALKQFQRSVFGGEVSTLQAGSAPKLSQG